METSFCELHRKEAVNLTDGKQLGKVSDVVFTYPEGRVQGIVVPGAMLKSRTMGSDKAQKAEEPPKEHQKSDRLIVALKAVKAAGAKGTAVQPLSQMKHAEL